MARILPQRLTWRLVMLLVFETVLILSAVALAAYIRLGADALELIESESAIPKGLLIAGVCQLCLYFGELYDFRVIADRRELFVRLLQALGATSLILAVFYFWIPDLVIGRGVFLIAAGLVILFVVTWRMTFEWLTRRLGPRERLLIVGTSAAAVGLARELYDRRQELGVQIVGFIEADAARVGAPVLNPGVVGTIEDIPEIVEEGTVDRVVVSLADSRGRLPMDRLLAMRLDGIAFDHLASVYEEYTGKIAIENLRPSWLIFSSGFRKTRPLRFIKRSIDVGGSVAGLLLAAPLILLTAIAIKLTSRGPVLYHQKRVGEHGRIFTVHKFRTMRQDAEVGTGAVWASRGDTRVTLIGNFLRRSRLDELPQLWNVLQGQMSLVGPRPERPEFVEFLTRDIPFYGQRHVVKPGLTGWAQVRYTYGASVEDAMEKLQYDLFYIKNMSIALDLFIILETVRTVVMRRGAR
jgi:sugar transferase (PEP-CTERM system associated)